MHELEALQVIDIAYVNNLAWRMNKVIHLIDW